ncbi:MAG: ABC transporter ATP-binding protein [Burkholderiaceae bacterium]|nr:ABC transporter ATP-binding protein [Burkholderiaceae bacterium]
MIRVQNIFAHIGPNQILRDVSLQADSGQIVAVIGANGAGKTSLLRAISGLLPVDSGNVEFNGQSIIRRPAHLLSRMGLIHIPQGRQIIPGLSVLDNLMIGATNAGISGHESQSLLEQQWERFPILQKRQHIQGTALSGGEQQMLAVARGLMMRPKVLMLDEPSLGLAPQVVRLIMETLNQLAAQGLAVVLVEQVAMLALEYAHHAIVLRNGECVLQGTGQELLQSKDLVNTYLG